MKRRDKQEKSGLDVGFPARIVAPDRRRRYRYLSVPISALVKIVYPLSLPSFIDTEDLPHPLDSMFQCRSCGLWYDTDSRGPHDQCKPCFWGLRPNTRAAVTRKQVIQGLAKVAEGLLDH